ncbi:MAG: DASH family cryptochrome [Candidatus Kapabacteria bacterium]|jgi:deoxyribodipyrimidine photo-lyase|nr:DASH family cryptochrome [Candidatus Kapabacteria bacterium]
MTLLHWFRNDLRIHDHRILGAIPDGTTHLLCVYVIDPQEWRSVSPGFAKTGAFRTRFLLEALADLDTSLQSLGNRLLVAVGSPADVIARLATQHAVDMVTADREVTSEECTTEDAVRRSLGHIPLHLGWSRTLFHPADLPFPIAELPNVFTTFRKAVEKLSSIRPELPTPTVVPPPPSNVEWLAMPTITDLVPSAPSDDARAVLRFVGGETAGLDRLNDYIWQRNLIATYKETRNGLIGEAYSSKLSPWLSLGCLSPRAIHAEVRAYERDVVSNSSTYWLVFELLWRDFFRFTAMAMGTRIFKPHGMKGAAVQWKHDAEVFEAWRTGTTGNDFVDANMRELLHTGWMSNRGRQNVASWLTKAKHIDWRWGARWFEHALVDYDVCSNWGNWAYVAGVGNDPREDRFFNTAKQAATYDEHGDYRRLWLSQ